MARIGQAGFVTCNRQMEAIRQEHGEEKNADIPFRNEFYNSKEGRATEEAEGAVTGGTG